MIPNNVNNLVIIVDILGGHYIMKFFKFFTSFIGIFIIVLFISYADIDNDWVESFVNTFEQTNAEFKFYDIKANCLIEGELCENEMKNICIDIVKALNLDPKDINWNIKDNKKELKIYAELKGNIYDFSFATVKKNGEESYIIVDILSNKVYKNIGDIYKKLYSVLNVHSNNIQVFTCIAGQYAKKLQLDKCNDILQNILYNMNAKEIDKVRQNSLISVTAYSKLLTENDLEYLEDKINLNIGIRYSENEDKTLIYIATPIIKLDY